MQEKNIDSLKFCISLLHKLKNQEPIDINNKLINVGILVTNSSCLSRLSLAINRH